jgi:4-amino-4-deoxy-L-arabinose transferase-like glycosyltransferase
VSEAKSQLRIKAWALALLFALCFIQFFWHLGDVPFYTRGESREGLVIWEMYRTGNWILPMINGDYIPFKPPLFHWVGVLASQLTGDVSELTVRFPSALFATLGVLLTYLVGTRLWNEITGRVAAFVLATNSAWWRAGTDAQVDMTLVFFITATLLLFYYMYQEGKHSRVHSIALAFLWACATLAKGPLGCLVPLLTVITFLGLRRDFAFVKRLHLVSGAAVFVLVAGSWYGLALWQGGPAFFLRQILEENIGTARGTSGHYQPFYYFIPVFFYDLAPWSFFFLPIAFFICDRRRTLSEDRLLFPLVWFISVFLFFSVSLGKRGVYILPLYPAFALLFGEWWKKCLKDNAKAGWLTYTVGYALAVSTLLVIVRTALFFLGSDGAQAGRLSALAGGAAVLADVLHSLTPPSPLVWIALAVAAGAAVFMAISLWRKNWNGWLVTIAILATMTTVLMKTSYYAPKASERTLKPFGVRLRQGIDAQTPLVFYNSFDAGTIFYSRRHIAPYSRTIAEINPPFFVLMWEENWQHLQDKTGLEIADISEGRGPVGKHHLVLVKSSKFLPMLNEKQESEVFRHDRDDLTHD